MVASITPVSISHTVSTAASLYSTNTEMVDAAWAENLAKKLSIGASETQVAGLPLAVVGAASALSLLLSACSTRCREGSICDNRKKINGQITWN
jgi:hypothetical protein